MDEPRLIALGDCWACGRPFPFDLDLVPSIPVDPTTNLPSDLGGDPELVVKQPVCEQCLDVANERRVAQGRPPIIVLPGAYG